MFGPGCVAVQGWPCAVEAPEYHGRSPVERSGGSMIRDIASGVRRVVSQQLDVDETRITAGASFTEDLGADSLGLVQLTLALEEEFDIDITDEDAEKIRTVQNAIRLIENARKRGSTPHSTVS